MKLKIISNGIPRQTKIVNLETGEELQGVTDIKWSANANDNYAKLVITLIKVDMDLETAEKVFIVSGIKEDLNDYISKNKIGSKEVKE